MEDTPHSTDDIFTMEPDHASVPVTTTTSVFNRSHATTHLLDHSVQCIKDLYEKYGHDLFLTSKIQHYISVQLPMMIANAEETRQRNQERISELTAEQEHFMKSFLSHNRYYYIPANETFYFYDGIHYKRISEDHILHHIVTSISNQRNILMEWKHKTKVSTIKRIKTQSLLKSVPESTTIQHVLQWLSPFFCNKKETKYFLSILGDNMLKKDSHLIHFIHPVMKTILRTLNQCAMEIFNVQCNQTFKMKCHEKHYEWDNKDCRLVPLADGTDETAMPSIHEFALDILCVASHYSYRYGRSDDFIKIYNPNDTMTSYVLRLCTITPEGLIDEFVKEYLFVIGPDSLPLPPTMVSSSPMDHYILQCNAETNARDMSQQISWKSMLYLWKDFLRVHKYPMNLFQTVCKSILTQSVFAKYYNREEEVFTGIGSSRMPIIYRFMRFWSETVVDAYEDHSELEIEELSQLFSTWLNKNYSKKRVQLSENEILDILRYYYPDLEIEKNKYIYKKKCLLWDKDMDIDSAMETLRENLAEDSPTVSLYDAYVHYCDLYRPEICVSKSYFEKYVTQKYKITSEDEMLHFVQF